MNAVEQIQQEVKSALREAVIEADLAEETAIPDIMLRNTEK